MESSYRKLKNILMVIFFLEAFIISELYFLLIYGFTHFMILLSVLSFVLCIESVSDFINKKIRMDFMFIAIALLVIYTVFFYEKSGFLNLFIGIVIGALFYLISILTKDGIGKGDAFIVGLIFACLGFKMGLLILLISLLILSLFGIAKIFIQKVRLSTDVPMLPFLYFSFLFVIFICDGCM